MPHEPSRIRNVAVVGHRGAGKTSLVESLLYEADAITRLGTVTDGSTVSDHDEAERRRSLSLSSSVLRLEWLGRLVNLLDTPGDPSFQADVLSALRVAEGAVLEVSGVAGVEVGSARIWARMEDLHLPRLVHVGLLDREQADFEAALASLQELSPRCIAVVLPMGQGADYAGIVDLVHMVAYADPHGAREGEPQPIPEAYAARADELHLALVEAVAESADELIAKYLEGEEISSEEMASALKAMVSRGELFPVTGGAALHNSGSHALLDLIVEALPSPVRKGPVLARTAEGEQVRLRHDADAVAYVFKTVADPYAGRLAFLRVISGEIASDSTLVQSGTHAKERVGQLLSVQGREHQPIAALGAGEIGAVAKLRDVHTGDLLLAREMDVVLDPLPVPAPVVSVTVEPLKRGDDEKVVSGLRRLAEEDGALGVRRDERTGELILEGLTQMHVDVTVERLRERFGVEVHTHEPRVPYLEAITRSARGHGRHKKQTGGRGQFGDCHITIEPIPGHEGYEFIDRIVGGVVPQSYRPAVDRGVQEAMERGGLAGYPVVGVRVTLEDGSYHSVDSSEMAFKIAGSLAFRDAFVRAEPVLLEPIMAIEVTVPGESTGDVTGDLSSRRGHLMGIETVGSSTVVHAEVPLAEVLSYSTSLVSMTGGRGDVSMSFVRYAEVPAHVAQRLTTADAAVAH